MRSGQLLLAGIAVGHPDVGSVISEHFCDDTACPALRNLVQHRLVRDEHPLALDHAVGPRCHLVRGDDPRVAQLLAIALVAVAMS